MISPRSERVEITKKRIESGLLTSREQGYSILGIAGISWIGSVLTLANRTSESVITIEHPDWPDEERREFLLPLANNVMRVSI
jgi:hypothetical protein